MTDRRSRPAWIAFGVSAIILLTFSNGKFSHPMAAWIAPFLFLRLLRVMRLRQALVVGYVGCWASTAIQWQNVFPLSGPLFYVASLLLCLVVFLPYSVDRILARRLGGLPGTFVLPTSMVLVEFLFANVSPYGAWGSIAYSQASTLVLAQVAAVTGMYGITFLIAWIAAVANLLIENRAARRRPHVPALIGVAAVGLAVLVYGAVRLTAPIPTRGSLRVATISPRSADDASYRIPRATELQDSLLASSRDAARTGAALIVWPEGSFSIFAKDEASWIARAGAFTAEEGVYLVAPYATRVSEEDARFENKMVLLAPDGSIAWTYLKARPVPGLEALAIPGDGHVATANLPTVRLAGMICFDADHPTLMRQVGNNADLLIVPSDDWEEIVTLHAAMIRMRAIEWGLPIIRSTLHGTSVAFDRFGRILGSDHDDGTGRTLVVDVVPGFVPTLYGRFVDWFVWLCGVGLAALLVVARAGRPALPASP